MKITATIAEMRAAMEKQNAMSRPLKPRVERDHKKCVRVEYGTVMACCVDE